MATLTRRTRTYDEATGIASETIATLTGAAFQKSTGEADAYERLGLTRSEAPLLLFVPSDYSDAGMAQVGDEIEWPTGGPTYLVRSARHIRPDGVADVISYLVIGR